MMPVFFCFILFLAYELYYVVFIPFNTHGSIVFYGILSFKILVLLSCSLWGLRQLFKKGKNDLLSIIIIVFYFLFVLTSFTMSVSPLYSLSQAGLLLLLFLSVNGISSCFVTPSINDKMAFKYISLFLTAGSIISILGYLIVQHKFVSVEAGAVRLHGIYGEPAHLGIMCGINIGIIRNVFKKKPVKISMILVVGGCLILTGFRTAVIALILSELVMIFISKNKSKNVKLLSILLVLFLICGIFFKYKDIQHSENRYLRLESATNLSGRVSIWDVAVKNSLQKFFGYGYCLGGGAMISSIKESNFDSFKHNSVHKATLHNGYIQALADVGVIGCVFYLLVFLKGLQFVRKVQGNKNVNIYVFIFLYLSCCNLTESTIMSPTSSATMLFFLSWFTLMKQYAQDRMSDKPRI